MYHKETSEEATKLAQENGEMDSARENFDDFMEMYSIPKGSIEAKDMDNLRVKLTNILNAELEKPKENIDLDFVNKLLDTVDTARRVYTGLALFSKIKFKLLQR